MTNHKSILAVLIICLLLWIGYSYVSEEIYPHVHSSYVPRQGQDIGFVKPENRLLKIFESVSSGAKIKLSGNCHQVMYNKQTIPADANERIVDIVKKLINTINYISGDDYYMKTIEQVYYMQDNKQNSRYIIGFFIYDIKNYYTIRLLGDIVQIDGALYINYLNHQTGSSPTLLNHYDVKFNSAGILLGENMFHENISTLFDTHYLNSYKVIGISDTDLEYSKEDLSDVVSFSSLTNGYFPSSVSNDSVNDLSHKGLDGYLEMYLPQNQQTIKDPLFCKKYKVEWDSHGIPLPNEHSDTCIRHNNQAQAKINDPWFGPGIMYDRSSNDAYDWLKDPGRGNIMRSAGY